MAPNGDTALQQGKSIASSFERAMVSSNPDFSETINALQTAARGKPEEYREALRIANQMLDNSNNPKVNAFFGKADIVEGSPSENTIPILRSNGGRFSITADAKYISQATGDVQARPTTDESGNRVSRVERNGITQERTVTRDNTGRTDKFKDRDGNEWQIDSRLQKDNQMHPTKVKLPDGSVHEYEWDFVSNEMKPVSFKETNKDGQVVKDYTMEVLDKSNVNNIIRMPTHWTKRGGEAPKDLHGNLKVESSGLDFGTSTFTDQMPPSGSSKQKPDGNWETTNWIMKNNQFEKVIKSGRRKAG